MPRTITFGAVTVMSAAVFSAMPVVEGSPEGIDALPLGTIGKAMIARGAQRWPRWHAVERQHGRDGEMYLANEIAVRAFAIEAD